MEASRESKVILDLEIRETSWWLTFVIESETPLMMF
jgi:hypothetical protein